MIRGILVTRKKRKGTLNVRSHIHDFYEIYYLVKGEMHYLIEDELFNVTSGDIVFVPRGIIHNTTYDDCDTERILINFSENYVSEDILLYCFEKRIITLPSGMRFDIENLLGKLEREYLSKDMYSERLVRQYLNEILIYLARIEIPSESKKPLDGNAVVIQNAVKYINENYASDLTLSDVASEFALSKSFFSRKFKQISGFGFNEYLTLVRISHAEKLLAQTELSVTEAALECGFNDSSYFAAVFKKFSGTTPYKYAISKRRKKD